MKKKGLSFILATAMLAGILPVMIIYPFTQKYFVKGIAIGAVKS